MRICFICVGGFRHIEPYLHYFKVRGHDVRFISLSPAPDYGVPTYDLGFGRKYTLTKGKWKYPISMLRARRLIKRLKPDIVHTHYATSGGLTGLVCDFHPTVVTVHGSDLMVGIKSRIWRRLLKGIFEHSDCVNVVSEDLRDMVLSLGISPDKIETFTPGVDTGKFGFTERPGSSRERTLRFVCTRRLEQVYDHPTIIMALGVLKEKGIRFHMTFVGGGRLKEELEQQVRDLGLAEQVTFLGEVANDKLPEILHENDIYLSASLRDGTSLCLLEAMAAGIFPIVSETRANAAWFEDGINGLLHKIGDADDLAKCILKVRDNPEIIVNAAQRNRQKVLESGDTKTNMKLLERIYEGLIHKTGSGSI